MKSLFLKKQKGVTLIELIFTLSLFSVIIIVVLSLLSMGVTAQRKVLALQDVQDNARFILEFIAKEVRMSTINGANTYTLNLTRSDGDVIEYTLINNDVRRMNISQNEGGPINSENINVTGSFYVTGIGAADNLEPKVTIALSVQGQGTRAEEQARIDLQTTLSQRILDLP